MPALTAAGCATNHRIADDWCPGCGLTYAVNGTHSATCAIEPAPLTCSTPDCPQTRPAGARTPVWRYQPATQTYQCPTHQKGAA